MRKFTVIDNTRKALSFPVGDWLIQRPDGLMCSGTYKTKHDAVKWASAFSNKSVHQRLDDNGGVI